jgi:hypothetical protein
MVMACLRFSKKITNLCGTIAGISQIYIANFEDIRTYTLDSNEIILSAITYNWHPRIWYNIDLNREAGMFMTEALINIPNGVALNHPKLNFKVQGLNYDIINMYNQLKQVTVVAVCRTIDNKLYALGFQNGLDTINCNIGTTAERENGFKGANFELFGTEKDPMYLLDDSDGGLGRCFPNCRTDCDILVNVLPIISLDFSNVGDPIQYANC